MHRLISALLLAVILSACGSSGTNEGPTSIVGQWQGEATARDTTYTITLQLQQPSGTNVVGEGTVTTSQTSISFTTNGSLVRRALSLTMTYQTMRPSFFSGQVAEDFERINGTWTGPPLGEQAIEFTRP